MNPALALRRTGRHFRTVSTITVLLVTWALVAAAEPKAKAALDTSTAKNLYFFSVGEVALDGAYDQKEGTISIESQGKTENTPFSEQQLRQMWGISGSKPGVFDGMTWSGKPIRVKVTGTKPSELGPKLLAENLDAGKNASAVSPEPFLFWTGHLNVKMARGTKVTLGPTDTQIVDLECKLRGLELKHHLENDIPSGSGTVWYLDPLTQEDRRDIADPLKSTSYDVIAPAADSNAVLVACWYRSISERESKQYRGPVFAYDRLYHAVKWRQAIDLANATFVFLGNTTYLLHHTYCDVCETHGYTLMPFSYRIRSLGPGEEGAPAIDHFCDKEQTEIGRTLSWF